MSVLAVFIPCPCVMYGMNTVVHVVAQLKIRFLVSLLEKENANNVNTFSLCFFIWEYFQRSSVNTLSAVFLSHSIV